MDILDYKESIAKIYFVRHGQTDANKKRLLFGHLDWDLNKEGIKEANNTAKLLAHTIKKEKIDLIITSPLKRAKHTAKIISKKLKIKNIIIETNLIEKSEGNWEGKSFWEVRDNDSLNYKKWTKDPFKVKPPKGESIDDLNKRVKKFHKTILKKYLGKSIIVVSHAGPIRLSILNILGSKTNNFWNLLVKCGSISEVHLSKKIGTVHRVNLT